MTIFIVFGFCWLICHFKEEETIVKLMTFFIVYSFSLRVCVCRSVLVRRELCHFSVPNVYELQWCLATVAICFYFMLTHLWNLFALIPGAEHITPNPAGCWLSVVVCIPLSSSSWVNKLRELNFENDEILQCISCRVMINSHLICSGSFVGLMDEMGARKRERVRERVQWRMDRERRKLVIRAISYK